MIEYKHQKLIYDYHLDIARFPEKLLHSIHTFSKMAPGVNDNKDASVLLEKLDNAITLNLLRWIKENEHSLSEIINTEISYRRFYHQLNELVGRRDFEKHSYTSGIIKDKEGIETVYDILFLKQTTFGECNYYSLEKYHIKEDKKICESVFVLKICGYLKTLQPVYYFIKKPEMELLSYDYLNNGPTHDFKSQKKMDKHFHGILKQLKEDKAIFDYDSISEIITRMLIALNENQICIKPRN